MPFEFDDAVAVEPTGTPGEYAATLDAGWVIGSAVNGGLLLALVASAARAHLEPEGKPEPITASTVYLSPSVPGPALVRVVTLRSGGRRTTVSASLVQEQEGAERERIRVLATFGTPETLVAPDVRPDRQDPPPAIPPPEACLDPRRAPDPDSVPPLMHRLGTRFDPATIGWGIGRPSGDPMMQGWFAFADERPVDPLALLLVVDSMPPTLFNVGLIGWAPTLELTAFVRARPAPGPLHVRHETRTVVADTFEEDCSVWDSTGRLVAQSRQLALVPRVGG